MVIEVLVAERDGEYPLPDQRRDRSGDPDGGSAGIVLCRSAIPGAGRAFDVIAPPSNAAITWRPSTASNPNISGIHSVCIGALLESSRSRSRKTTFADSEPRCA